MISPRAQHHANRRLQIALAIALILTVFSAVLGLAVFRAVEESNRVSFGYYATLTLNGTGTARISLPLPVDEVLLTGLSISPDSSGFVINRSGGEPALDVTLSETTWVNISTRTTRSSLSHPVDLTRVAEYGVQCDECPTELAVEVLGGMVFGVRVELIAGWSYDCFYPRWAFEGWVFPGAGAYHGDWLTMVC